MIRFMILFALACNVAFATETYKAKVGEYTYSYAITPICWLLSERFA